MPDDDRESQAGPRGDGRDEEQQSHVSGQTTRSALRHARAEAGLLEEFEAKMEALIGSFKARKAQLGEELRDEDVRSEVAKETGEVPTGTAAEMDVGVLDRKIAAAKDDLDRLVRLRSVKASQTPQPKG